MAPQCLVLRSMYRKSNNYRLKIIILIDRNINRVLRNSERDIVITAKNSLLNFNRPFKLFDKSLK